MAVASCYGHFLSSPSTLYPSSSLNPKQTKADSSTLHPSSSLNPKFPLSKLTTLLYICRQQTENKRNIQKQTIY